MFAPSAARTITVGASNRAFTAPTPGYWTMTDPAKPRGIKDPNSTLDITFDWTQWLADIGGIPIKEFEFLPADGLTVVTKFQFVAGKVTAVVTVGDLGKLAPLTSRITTDTVPPLIEDRTIYLSIEER